MLELLKARQNYSLKGKIYLTEQRIKEWYTHWSGKVYVSFSGGKDSTVLLDIVRKIYPEVPAVFVNTGLEYPEIIDFVKTFSNVIWLKPKKPFFNVISEYGYPLISKKVSRFIRDLQNRTAKNMNTVNLRLTGYNQKGIFCPSQKIPKKWLKLVDSGFKISEECCYFLKKEPFHRFQKENDLYPITAVMASESSMRQKQYLNQGCNAFNSKSNPISMPMAFWLEKDIWDYLTEFNIKYSKIYDLGEKRTGCMFCMFGVHLEESPNRFQRMKLSHPKIYDYCIHKLGLNKILDFINVNYQ